MPSVLPSRLKWPCFSSPAHLGTGELFLGEEMVRRMRLPSRSSLAWLCAAPLFFSLFQIFFMFWVMSRPRYESICPEIWSDLTWNRWIAGGRSKKKPRRWWLRSSNWERVRAERHRPANGALFFGPPGTGKSLIAKVIASMSRCLSSSSTPLSQWSLRGHGHADRQSRLSRKIRKLTARYGGCIVFLDEIDAIGLARGGLIGQGQVPGRCRHDG